MAQAEDDDEDFWEQLKAAEEKKKKFLASKGLLPKSASSSTVGLASFCNTASSAAPPPGKAEAAVLSSVTASSVSRSSSVAKSTPSSHTSTTVVLPPVPTSSKLLCAAQSKTPAPQATAKRRLSTGKDLSSLFHKVKAARKEDAAPTQSDAKTTTLLMRIFKNDTGDSTNHTRSFFESERCNNLKQIEAEYRREFEGAGERHASTPPKPLFSSLYAPTSYAQLKDLAGRIIYPSDKQFFEKTTLEVLQSLEQEMAKWTSSRHKPFGKKDTCLCLVGKPGSGKSTTLRLFAEQFQLELIPILEDGEQELIDFLEASKASSLDSLCTTRKARLWVVENFSGLDKKERKAVLKALPQLWTTGLVIFTSWPCDEDMRSYPFRTLQLASWRLPSSVMFMHECCNGLASEARLEACLRASGGDMSAAWSTLQFLGLGGDDDSEDFSTFLKSVPPSNLKQLVQETLVGRVEDAGALPRKYNLLELSDVPTSVMLLNELTPAAMCFNTKCPHTAGGTECRSNVKRVAELYEACSLQDCDRTFNMLPLQSMVSGIYQRALLGATPKLATMQVFKKDLMPVPQCLWATNRKTDKTVDGFRQQLFKSKGLTPDADISLGMADLRVDTLEVSLVQGIRGYKALDVQQRVRIKT